MEIKGKLTPAKDYGDGSSAKALAKLGDKLHLTTLLGVVDRIVARTDPVGGVYYGFGGTFEVHDMQALGNATQSGLCYVPNDIFASLRDTFNAIQKDNANAGMCFALAVWTVKADNAAGYTWSYVPLVEPVPADPLHDLRSKLIGAEAVAASAKPKAPGASKPARRR